MWTYQEILEYLKKHLKEKRFNHTLGVVECARQLAKINGIDQKKAEIAALAHDCAKNMDDEEAFRVLEQENIELDSILKDCTELLHGKVGAIIGRKIFEINDLEILNAIEYHTTGRENMTLLEKVIYIADYIEPNRSYEGVSSLRDITFKDLDSGVLKGIDNTITFLIKEKKVIHPQTINARNYLLKEIEKKSII